MVYGIGSLFVMSTIICYTSTSKLQVAAATGQVLCSDRKTCQELIVQRSEDVAACRAVRLLDFDGHEVLV